MATLYSSIFGELTRHMQVRFDAISQTNAQVFDKVIYEDYLTWDTPSISLKFEELIGQYNITIAAPTIGKSSKESIIGNEGLQVMSEKLLRHAITKPMLIEDYRKILEIKGSALLSNEQQTEQLINLMFGDARTVVNGIRAKLDLLFLQGLSNGKVVLDESNNPEGGARGEINYNQPAENIATAATEWTEDDKESVDPLEDIMALVDAAQDKVQLAYLLMAPSKLNYILRSPVTRRMMWGSDKAAKLVTLADYNQYLEENGLPTIKTIRRQVRIQDHGTTRLVTPWNEKNIVAIPEGKLGVIKNAYANSELKAEPGVAYSDFGRIRVSQWGVGETQGSEAVEFIKAEATALPVITEMPGIYTLKTED